VIGLFLVAATIFVASTARLASTACEVPSTAGPGAAAGAGLDGAQAALAAAGQAGRVLAAADYMPDKSTVAAAVRILQTFERQGSAGTLEQQQLAAAAQQLATAVIQRAGGITAARKLAGLDQGASDGAVRVGTAAAGVGTGGPETADTAFTQQTCYLQSDESEVCVFDNLMCFDGKSPVVTVEKPIRDPERILDYTHSCK
jgi:hypothetical protein